MKYKKGFKYKIKYTAQPLPQFMFAILDDSGLLELESNEDENYIRLFQSEAEASVHISTMNNEFCIHPGNKKVYWYKNRGNKPFELNTKLKKFKSKYMPLSAAINLFN